MFLESDNSEEDVEKKISWVLSRLLPHFIDPQSLGKAVQCNMNVNTQYADWGGDFPQSQSHDKSCNANICINSSQLCSVGVTE